MKDIDYIKKLLDRMNSLELKCSSEYTLTNGNHSPRVTEILSQMLHEEYLLSWANSLGFKHIGYRSYMNEAANKGTYSHMAIERFLKNREFPDINKCAGLYPEKIVSTVRSTFSGFMKWWEKLNKNHTVDIVCSEEKLVHPYFSGTCDCVLKIDDEYWLIDFKTSNHMNYKYTLQLSAYGYLLKELKDITISRYVVLMLDKVNYSYTDYVLDMHNKEHADYINLCLETFFTLTAAYKLRLESEDEYKRIFNIKKR